jgi:hypothetical protein
MPENAMSSHLSTDGGRLGSELAPAGGALLSSDDFGSSVERTAKLHPLWQVVQALEWPGGSSGLSGDGEELI